jgi:hypothetical protein
MMRTSSSTIIHWQRRNINGPCGPVVVEQRFSEPHYTPCLAWEEEATLIGRATLPLTDLSFWAIGLFPERCAGPDLSLRVYPFLHVFLIRLQEKPLGQGQSSCAWLITNGAVV